MKNIIKKFIASAVCDGIDKYVKSHRFGMRGQIEIIAMTENEFRDHLGTIFQSDKAINDYLLRAPTTHPHSVHTTK